ncbi:hypothetical protein [Pinisolibacter sp.]|uniref:hypothetical protein n=1 Tax=Pinisolibacter sp. TaxID=2172024 RepID=UPI002FDCDC35
MRAAILTRALAVAAVTSSLAAPAVAAEDAETSLRTLYRIALSADMCGFPMQKRQAEVLGKAIDKALAESGLDEDKAEALYNTVDTGLEAEGWDKVCAQKGDWARDYRAVLAAKTE